MKTCWYSCALESKFQIHMTLMQRKFPRTLTPRPEDFSAPTDGKPPDPERIHWLNKPMTFSQLMDNTEERQRIFRQQQRRKNVNRLGLKSAGPYDLKAKIDSEPGS